MSKPFFKASKNHSLSGKGQLANRRLHASNLKGETEDTAGNKLNVAGTAGGLGVKDFSKIDP